MLHGFGDTLESLKPLACLLSESRQVLLIDLPGFGKSPYDESLTSAQEMGEALVLFLRHKGIEQFDILGHSFGGKVAMTMSSHYPDLVRKSVLVGSSGLKRKRGFQETLHFRLIKGLGTLVKMVDSILSKELFLTWFSPRFASSDYQNFPKVRKILVRSINENIDTLIRSIQQPTLLLWGGLDTETPLEMGYRLKNMIKDSNIVVYPTLGHRPFKDVGRYLIKEHLEQFLEADVCRL